ncbi:albusnodin family lasso peptide [Kitasatospora sp. NBC_01300]|nr:albusnodin family lasso peptide [Kitasatospora sp. NBC_01300]
MEDTSTFDPEQDGEVVILGDAAALTNGSNSNSVEGKRSPYDAA